MEKFNAIKILEEEQKDNELFHRNLGKEHYMKQVEKFVTKYLLPRIKKLNDEGKITYNPNTDDEQIFMRSKQLEIDMYGLVKNWALEYDIKFGIDIFDFSDKELINAVVTDMVDFVVNTYEQYIVDYDDNAN